MTAVHTGTRLLQGSAACQFKFDVALSTTWTAPDFAQHVGTLLHFDELPCANHVLELSRWELLLPFCSTHLAGSSVQAKPLRQHV